MRLRILGLFFLVFLPPSLIAQQRPTPTPPEAQQKASEFGPLLPFSGAKGGQLALEINSVNTYYSGGFAIADIDVVIRYGNATMYCDHAEYNADSHDIFLKGNVKFYRD